MDTFSFFHLPLIYPIPQPGQYLAVWRLGLFVCEFEVSLFVFVVLLCLWYLAVFVFAVVSFCADLDWAKALELKLIRAPKAKVDIFMILNLTS